MRSRDLIQGWRYEKSGRPIGRYMGAAKTSDADDGHGRARCHHFRDEDGRFTFLRPEDLDDVSTAGGHL